MALQEPYISSTEADEYLEDSAAWNNATDSEKDQALFWGRIYIDTNFTCSALIADPANPSENVKYANALLAEDWLEGTLFQGEDTRKGTMVHKRVRAGSVESQKSYYVGSAQEDISNLLSSECSKNIAKTKQILRM